ncbi:uncharacterized protein [Lolium perenne]|uniref:uncharacterized protein n=1 Tax=Lolium perenne TaxID=4522 RepID=UPI0021F60DEC|nr:uncharacterized protein LOC127319136 [Lolium perenne]
MSAPVERSTKERTMEANKRKLRRDEEEDAWMRRLATMRERRKEKMMREKINLEKAGENDSSFVLVPGANLFFTDPKAFFSEIYKDEKPAPNKVEIPTLDRFETPTIFHTRRLLPIREPGSKAVLSAAKSLLGISSSLGGEPLKRCSGFWIDFDEGSKTGTVLTTAHLIHTNDPPDTSSDVWIDEAHYDSKANVTVHLLDGTTAEAQLLYYQPHYDLAVLSVKVDQPVHLPSFNEGVKFSQKVFRLGRDNSLKLRITYGRAAYFNPDMYERYHNMYFDCADHDSDSDDDDDDDHDNEYDDGGIVIDLDGGVVGMVNISSTLGSFIPSSILLKCWASWKSKGRILRPHLGMMFKAIKLLEPAFVDDIWRAYNIDDGLIVQEVSKGSYAEKIGIERGDIIESFNGSCISTTVELENMLMSLSNDSLDSQKCLNNEFHFSVVVFHTLRKQRTTSLLTANVSECGEVIVKGHLVS